MGKRSIAEAIATFKPKTMMATPLQALTRSISAHRIIANVKGLTHHANYLYGMNKRHSIGTCALLVQTIATRRSASAPC